jgi:predicted N-acetyltransferase YhbS
MAGLAAFVTLLLLTKIDIAGFRIFILVFVTVVFIYVYRAIKVVAIADRSGIEVQNLIKGSRFDWSEVDVLAVIPTKSGSGTGITIKLKDGSILPIEASWGPWYQGKMSAETTIRCERLIEEINLMREYDPDRDDPEPEVPVDPVAVRPATAQDADLVAGVIETAWRETYAEILPGSMVLDRSTADDAQMLRELLDGSTKGAGSLVVERDGEVVGASVFGPIDPVVTGGFTEIYMLYVRADEVGSGVGRRLVLRTFGTIRESGANGIVGHVYVNNRRLRAQLDRMDTAHKGDIHEQVWYGLPVKVIEYRLTL